jgi:hypothetical protein
MSQVYSLILQDLKEAQPDLSTAFVDGYLKKVTERIRPTKWAAAALLARVYLYLQDWASAEAQATMVIGHPDFLMEPNLDNVFLIPSKEAILQLQPLAGDNTKDGSLYNAHLLGGTPNFLLSPSLIASFDSSDVRLKKWILQTVVPASGSVPAQTYLSPFKFKMGRNTSTTEYLMVLRLAEQYLIRAEARAQQNNLVGAKTDLDAVRARAGLPGVTVTTKEAMLQAIAKERQVELFTEWGHRWFDLKRTGAIDSVMTHTAVVKGTTWKPHFKLFPIPQTEIQANPNLTQNPGY